MLLVASVAPEHLSDPVALGVLCSTYSALVMIQCAGAHPESMKNMCWYFEHFPGFQNKVMFEFENLKVFPSWKLSFDQKKIKIFWDWWFLPKHNIFFTHDFCYIKLWHRVHFKVLLGLKKKLHRGLIESAQWIIWCSVKWTLKKVKLWKTDMPKNYIFSRPGGSQGLLYKHLRHWFIY